MPEETNKAKGEEELAPVGADDSESPEALAVAPADSPPRPRRKRWLRRTLLSAAPVLAIAASGYVYMTGGRFVETENAYVKADTVSIAAQVSGPIVEVTIRENARVAKGQILFRIDDRPYRVAVARAPRAAASGRRRDRGSEGHVPSEARRAEARAIQRSVRAPRFRAEIDAGAKEHRVRGGARRGPSHRGSGAAPTRRHRARVGPDPRPTRWRSGRSGRAPRTVARGPGDAR